jgi:hypothetical protein
VHRWRRSHATRGHPSPACGPVLSLCPRVAASRDGRLRPHYSAVKVSIAREHASRDGADRTWTLLLVAFLVAAVPPIALRWAHVYTGPEIWPGLVGNSTGSLVAFVLALEWERRRTLHEDRRTIERRRRDLDEEADRTLRNRRQEASRRLRGIHAELVDASADVPTARTALARQERVVLSPIRSGGWAASAQHLAELLSDSELVGDLSSFYSLVVDFQWTLRLRAEAALTSELNTAMTNTAHTLGRDIENALPSLIERVEAAIDDPPLSEIGPIRVRVGDRVLFGPAIN